MSEVVAFIAGCTIGAIPSVAAYCMCRYGVFDKFVELSKDKPFYSPVLLENEGRLLSKKIVDPFCKPSTRRGSLQNRKSSSYVHFPKTGDLWRGQRIKEICYNAGKNSVLGDTVTVTTDTGVFTMSIERYILSNPGPALGICSRVCRVGLL